MWKTMDEATLKSKKVAELKEIAKTFTPALGEKERKEKLDGWHRAVRATMAFKG